MTEEEIIEEFLKENNLTLTLSFGGLCLSHCYLVKFIDDFGIENDFKSFIKTLHKDDEKTLEKVYNTMNLCTAISFELGKLINEIKEEK